MIEKAQTKKIKQAIVDKEITRLALAKTLGISRQYLYLIMYGKKDNYKREKDLTDFLGV